MHRNEWINLLEGRFLLLLVVCLGLCLDVRAQTATPNSNPDAVVKINKSKKQIKIDFEDQLIKGDYDVPDTLFLNSRRLVKYKELFNRRTNFIEEIEANKGVFNEYQK